MDLYGFELLEPVADADGRDDLHNDDDRQHLSPGPLAQDAARLERAALPSLRSLGSDSLPAANLVSRTRRSSCMTRRAAPASFSCSSIGPPNMRGLHYDEDVAGQRPGDLAREAGREQAPGTSPGMNGHSTIRCLPAARRTSCGAATSPGTAAPSRRRCAGWTARQTQIRLAVRSFAPGANAITVNLLPGAHWRPWFRIGQAGSAIPTGSPVTSVARKAEQLDLFVAGTDGNVYSAYWNPVSGWKGSFSIGRPAVGVRPGAAITAVARKAEQLDLFVTGTDGGIYSAYWNPASGWSSWFRIGQPGSAIPAGSQVTAVARKAEQLDLFIAGTDGNVYSAYWNPVSGWKGWFSIGTPAGGVRAGATVTAVARKAEQLDLFVAAKNGGIYSAYWSGGGWSGWFRIGQAGSAIPSGSPVTAVARKAEQLDLFVAGYDGNVYSAYWNPSSGWQGWFSIGAPGSRVAPGSPVTAVARKAEQLDLFTVGNDGGIYSAYWNPASGWSGWFRIEQGVALPRTPVSAVARKPEQLDLFTVGTDGGIYSAWWGD